MSRHIWDSDSASFSSEGRQSLVFSCCTAAKHILEALCQYYHFISQQEITVLLLLRAPCYIPWYLTPHRRSSWTVQTKIGVPNSLRYTANGFAVSLTHWELSRSKYVTTLFTIFIYNSCYFPKLPHSTSWKSYLTSFGLI